MEFILLSQSCMFVQDCVSSERTLKGISQVWSLFGFWLGCRACSRGLGAEQVSEDYYYSQFLANRPHMHSSLFPCLSTI